jgi:hypothetical protein
LITCNLTKPETAFDQVRKSHPKLQPTDAALIATALVEAGRCAAVDYDGNVYEWTHENHDKLTKAVLAEVMQISLSQEPVKKTAKTAKSAPEDEPSTLTIPLRASQVAGESVLGNRKDLKTLLSDVLQEGVEYLFSPTDIGWQWALERANWSSLAEQDLGRRLRFSVEFIDNSIAVELGPGGKKKAPKKR